jgi:hypothetical protein
MLNPQPRKTPAMAGLFDHNQGTALARRPVLSSDNNARRKSMKILIPAVVSLALVASLDGQVNAAPLRNKNQVHRQHTMTTPRKEAVTTMNTFLIKCHSVLGNGGTFTSSSMAGRIDLLRRAKQNIRAIHCGNQRTLVGNHVANFATIAPSIPQRK